MTDNSVLLEKRGQAYWITINRPDKRNALNGGVIAGIARGYREAHDDKDVRVIVLTGTGDKAFCAGADLQNSGAAFSMDFSRPNVDYADLLRLSSGSSRWLRRFEARLHPHDGWFTSPAGDRLVGWLTVLCAVMLILPGPGTNGPPAFGNIVMALGVVERDNRLVGWGVALTAAGCLFAAAVLVAICWLGFQGLSWVL